MPSPPPALTLACPFRLDALGGAPPASDVTFSFHVRRQARDEFGWDAQLFAIRGDVLLPDMGAAHTFVKAVNERRGESPSPALRPAEVLGMGLVHEVLHGVLALYAAGPGRGALTQALGDLKAGLGLRLTSTLTHFVQTFPPPEVYAGKVTAAQFLAGQTGGRSHEEWVLEELLLVWIASQNPAYEPIRDLVTDADLRSQTAYGDLLSTLSETLARQPTFGPDGQTLVELLLAPIRSSPNSIAGQLDFMRTRWGLMLGEAGLLRRLLFGVDSLTEEGRWFLRRSHGTGDGSMTPPTFGNQGDDPEPEAFSADKDWMPNVVMVAKSTFVWLHQLTRKHGRAIERLSDIPDEELDTLAARGINALWLIGLWRRSRASQRIKQRHGDESAVASAYSLDEYEIADDLGGHGAYDDLRHRAAQRGIRLASDMVPNHMGIDSKWVLEHPDWFMTSRDGQPPFPGYSFDGPDLSDDPRVGVFLEDGYWSRRDAAVVFKRLDRWTGEARFLYHGNDGTSMPWNDTAQLDYLKAEVREAVIQTILHVARMFPIIRFDAAMTLAKRHYERLWYPVPGHGGDIPSRAAYALTKDDFERAFPVEFWREVVDRVAREVPETLLLAEAFWMMEGYFVRSLGMHRVYNSAFMNMLKKEDNASFRTTLKNVLTFEPQILKRHVNFMNNPDEETAVAQFGKDDKYFGVCVMMATLPGLPMFGHGQVEGFTEKYGMEFKRPRHEEDPDQGLVDRHEREVFPLLRKRWLFSGVEGFRLYDFVTDHGHVDEDVFAYSNHVGGERALVLVHNKFKETRGRVKTSVGATAGGPRPLHEGLGLSAEDGRFVVYREAMSGLEHLIAARDLARDGLWAELQAFKYRVFWQFREVTHTAEAPYGDLARELGGTGVPSLDDALLDLVDRSVHRSLDEAVGPGSIAYLLAQWDEVDEAPTTAGLTAFRQKVGYLADGLAHRMGAALPVAADDVATSFEAIFTRIVGSFQRPPASVPSPAAPATPLAATVLLGWLFTETVAHLQGEATGTRSFDELRLARCLRRTFLRGHGEHGETGVDGAVALVRGLRSLPAAGGATPEPSLAEITSFALKAPDLQGALGINTFEGVTYLSKERLDLFLTVVKTLRGFKADGAATIAALAAREGYRVDALLAALRGPTAPPPAAPPKAPKPTAGSGPSR